MLQNKLSCEKYCLDHLNQIFFLDHQQESLTNIDNDFHRSQQLVKDRGIESFENFSFLLSLLKFNVCSNVRDVQYLTFTIIKLEIHSFDDECLWVELSLSFFFFLLYWQVSSYHSIDLKVFLITIKDIILYQNLIKRFVDLSSVLLRELQ